MTQLPNDFAAYLVRRHRDGRITAEVARRAQTDLPPGDVLIRVAYSSLNYKDALSATGHPGVTKLFPHIPGIDAAGVVAQSSSPRWSEGQQVLVTGYDLGSTRWGGYAEYARVPADWVVALPEGLSPRESMILGTAGFTAGLSVAAIVEHELPLGEGQIVVTGGSGGVGSLAIAMLAKLGYHVVAVSGKPESHVMLQRLGARQIIGREEVDDRSGKPLLSARWSGAIDTVGGNVLSTLLRSTRSGGCVTACGVVGGADLVLTVHPFILRGVSLVGINSAGCPMERRLAIWSKLAGPWKPEVLDSLATEIGWSQLDHYVAEILAGRVSGRVLVKAAPE